MWFENVKQQKKNATWIQKHVQNPAYKIEIVRITSLKKIGRNKKSDNRRTSFMDVPFTWIGMRELLLSPFLGIWDLINPE